jgi:hypothetical protein
MAWDLAFHCVPLALVDPEFAKQQLLLMLREWYMHPNGQLPAYEWALGDAKPPSSSTRVAPANHLTQAIGQVAIQLGYRVMYL